MWLTLKENILFIWEIMKWDYVLSFIIWRNMFENVLRKLWQIGNNV